MASSRSFGNIDNFITTTESPSRVANETDFDIWAVSFVSTFYLYYTPILVFLGVFGNLVSLYVFHATKLRLQSTSQYLSALAVSDTLFLLQLLPPWLSAAQVTGIFFKKIYCQVFVYISYVSCCLSAWLVFAFTIERFVAVIYPLRRNAVCTVARARYVIIGVVLTSVVLNVPVLKLAAASEEDCNIDREYLDHAARFNLVDTIVSFTIPLGGIVFLNTWIMFGVWRLERTRRRLMKTERPRGLRRARCTRLLGCQRAQQRVTRMLLIVSSVFVVFNFPAYTIRILAYAYDLNTQEVGSRWEALQQITLLFFNTNFAINFILYCVAGQNFRHSLMQSIPWLRRRRFASRDDTAIQPRTGSLSISYASHTDVGNYISNALSTAGHVNSDAALRTDSLRPDNFIMRWTFDNNRQRRHNQPTGQIEDIEMGTFAGI